MNYKIAFILIGEEVLSDICPRTLSVSRSEQFSMFTENCELSGADGVQGQMSEHLFAPNGGYCVYCPSKIFRNTRGFENWKLLLSAYQDFLKYASSYCKKNVMSTDEITCVISHKWAKIGLLQLLSVHVELFGNFGATFGVWSNFLRF